MAKEVEIKFHISDERALSRALKQADFRQITASTHEINTLYDLPGEKLRKRGDLLRLRQYGEKWTLTHKAKGTAGRHKVRGEDATRGEGGKQIEGGVRGLGVG